MVLPGQFQVILESALLLEKETLLLLGASSYHYGCDIPAPQGTKLIAVSDGVITFRQFLGAGGYTITLSFSNFKVSYCHVDPNFIVSVGDFVKQGQVIRICWSKICLWRSSVIDILIQTVILLMEQLPAAIYILE